MKDYELPYMKEVAIWFVDNTSLSPKQISDFCNLDEVIVQSFIDGVIPLNAIQVNPIVKGYLSQEEIKIGEKDNEHELKKISFLEKFHIKPKVKKTSIISTAQKRETIGAAAWLIKFYPDIVDSKIAKLTHSTTTTVFTIRNKTHKKANQIAPINPTTVHLCTQIALENTIKEAGYELS